MNQRAAFPAECLGEILQHLSGKELLMCTEVCHDWNHFIGSTTACMAKVQFNTWRLESGDDASVALAIIRRRKYQNFIMNELDFASGAIIVQRALCKSVQMNNFSIPINTFLEILNVLRPNIEKLVLNSIQPTSKHSQHSNGTVNEFFKPKNESEVFSFDQLQTLKIMKRMQSFSLDYIRVPKLKVLHFSSELGQGSCTIDSVRRFLYTLPALRDLRISQIWFKLIFFDYKEDFPFQLDSISIVRNHENISFWGIDKEKFRKFLSSQKRIREFKLLEDVGFEVMKMICRIETLKKLTINYPFYSLPHMGVKLQSLDYLDIITFDCSRESEVKFFLGLYPGLKYLRIGSISTGVARFIKDNLKQIQKIRLIHRQDDEVEALLPNVEWE